LKHHPIRCGLLKYEVEMQLQWNALEIEKLGADVLYLGWLYVVGSRILYPDAPKWPDMEYVVHGQGERLFFGESPNTLQEAVMILDLHILMHQREVSHFVSLLYPPSLFWLSNLL
jgi:hypothetical protein